MIIAPGPRLLDANTLPCAILAGTTRLNVASAGTEVMAMAGAVVPRKYTKTALITNPITSSGTSIINRKKPRTNNGRVFPKKL